MKIIRKAKRLSKKPVRKGDQCIQNPKFNKFRSQAQTHAISKASRNAGLTVDALSKHDEQLEEDAVSQFGGLAISEATGVSARSKAFSISGLTDCSNITFHKVLEKWNSTSEADRERCAVLAAVTEVIRTKGGNETESEYFAALMTALGAVEAEEGKSAIVYLLSLVIKKVPTALLKAKFSEVCKLLVELLEASSAEQKTSTVICVLDCLTTVLMAQDQVVWTESSTLRAFQIILSFVVHGKPKVRKASQHSVKQLLKLNLANHKNHPVGPAVAKFCAKLLEQHTPEAATVSHYILNLLKSCLPSFGPEHMKQICETILQLMALNNVIMKSNSLETLHALFAAHPPDDNLTADLNGKMISALYDFQPSINDAHVAAAWLSTMEAAHDNLTLIRGGSDDSLQALPKFFGSVMQYLASDHQDVISAALDTIKKTTEKCLEPHTQLLVDELQRKKGDSAFSKIFHLLESGMKYKYQPVWDKVLLLLALFFETFGRSLHSVMLKCIVSLIDLKDSPDFPYMSELNKAIGAAFKVMGPRVILEAAPLNLVRTDGICSFPRAWLLPLMKDNIQATELQFFASHFLPTAAHLRQTALDCRKRSQDLEAKVYETLQFQIWSLLPGFCTNPTDLRNSFKNIAKILGTALMERADLRPIVLQSLRTLISKADDKDSEVISQYSKNYLPILFNLFTSENEDCQSISLSVLETVKSLLLITDATLIATFLERVLTKLSEEESPVKRHQLMDLSVVLTKYAGDDHAARLYRFAVDNFESSDKITQKKAYRILEEICESKSDSCVKVIDENLENAKKLLCASLSQSAPSSKAPRLRCLSLVVRKLKSDQKNFIVSILPEVILCTKEVGSKAKTAAFDLLVEIGNVLVFLSPLPKEDVVQDYFKLVMAGLAGSPHMISATLLAFTKLVFEYRHCLATDLIAVLLDAAVELLKSKTREVVKSALLFIRGLVKILDKDDLSSHLKKLVRNLFVWNTSKKNAYRQQVRVILERLLKKFGVDVLRPLMPEEHKKFLYHIHKSFERTKRQKEARRKAYLAGDVIATDEEERKADTWEDILADAVNDEAEEDKNSGDKKRSGKTRKKDPSWIMEGEEAVDLLDPMMAKNVVGTKPKSKSSANRRPEAPDFKFSADGKIIIEDEEADDGESKVEKLDVGEREILGGFVKAPKQIKSGKRKLNEEMPDNGDSSLNTYQPGGSGIHRRREDDDQRVQKKKKFGEEYKAKKAGGDMKVRGKPDPYAYIPFDRQKLNKRKKAKLAGEFHGVVKGAKRGAVKASKLRRKQKN